MLDNRHPPSSIQYPASSIQNMAKITELRDMSDEQLGLTLKEANENLFRLKIQQQTEKLDAPSELRRNRRLVARIKTLQTQRTKKAAAK
jgi:large subunit ribosomal protein L29